MMEWIKNNLVFVIVVVILLSLSGLAVTAKLISYSQPEKPKTSQTSASTASSSSSVPPETANEKNYRTAKLKLERPYAESSAEEKQQVATAFDKAIASISQADHLSAVKGTIDNHLSMTNDAMTQTLAMAILVNQYRYQPAQLEVTPSKHDDVVQFLIVLTKDGEDNCYFVGNFNTTVGQIQLKAYVGGNIGGTYG